MSPDRGLLVLILAALCSLSAYAADQSVEIVPGLEGKLHQAAGAMPERAVLLLHGWNGSMDEVGNLYADLAAELGRRGIASLRFNFSGEGERVGFVVTSTLDSRITETVQAYEYLRKAVPNARYGVHGFSLGGLTAMTVAAAHPEWFQTMVLWSAAESMSMSGDKAYADAVMRAVREGEASYETWTTLTLTRQHVTSFLGVDASLTLDQYPGAFLSIRGDRDYVSSHERKWLQLLPTMNKSFLLIGGADHIYNVLEDPRPDYGIRAITAAADFFEQTLD